MLEDLEKDQEFTETEYGKRKRAYIEPRGSRQTLKFELERFGDDLSKPIVEPAVETEEVELYTSHSGKMIRIGKNLEPKLKEKVIAVVCQYHDVFAWGPEDILGLDPKMAKHCLNIKPKAKPVKQQKQTFTMER